MKKNDVNALVKDVTIAVDSLPYFIIWRPIFVSVNSEYPWDLDWGDRLSQTSLKVGTKNFSKQEIHD